MKFVIGYEDVQGTRKISAQLEILASENKEALISAASLEKDAKPIQFNVMVEREEF